LRPAKFWYVRCAGNSQSTGYRADNP
jgi:hypothetical protein